MKVPNWIKRILHRASITDLNPRWFVSQYRVKLVQEGGTPFVKLRIDTVKKARAIVSRCFEAYGQTDRKQFGVIMLTNQNQVIGFNIAATGSVSSVLVSPREVLKPAILNNAGAIILCYTQPDGDVLPSREDLSNVQKIVRAAWVIGIRVVDHLTISTGDGGYFSFAERGIIQKIYQSMNRPASAARDSEGTILTPKSATLH
jgi:DNA repair protein RadC